MKVKTSNSNLIKILGILLFVVILSRIDLREVGRQFRNTNIKLLLLSITAIFVLIVIKSARWKYIARIQGTEIPLGKSILAYTASLYLGIVTPGRIGDFAKSYYLYKSGMSAGKALFSSLIDRLFDIIILLIIGYLSLFFFPDIIKNQILSTSLLFLLIIALILIVISKRKIIVKLIRRFVSGVKFLKKGERVSELIEDMLNEFSLLNLTSTVKITLLTLTATIFHYSYFVISAKALGINIPLGTLILCISAAIFVGLIPVSIAGVGTRDAALIVLFSHIGHTREEAISFSFVFILSYLIIGIVGFICWNLAPFRMEKEE